jgi:hypothetical protein
MGVMYAMKCDLCGEIQVKDQAHEIKGKTYTEDGKTMFSCEPCRGKLKTAMALGKGGLDDPLAAAGRLLEQKDGQIRNLELQGAASSGSLMGVADELRKKREGGSFIPVAGLDFETQHRQMRGLASTGQDRPRHALPAPAEKGKSKKRKK